MMSSISTQQGTILQQIGAGQRPPPPPPFDGMEAGTGSADLSGMAEVEASENRPPPPPPPLEGGQMGSESGAAPGADTASVLQGLFEALNVTEDSESQDLLTTLSAITGYGAAQSIFEG